MYKTQEKILINNNDLTPEMERIRSGGKQLFRRKGLDREFTSSENADVILQHERPEMYAELIDGKWYWVNGCAECNGEPRDWMTYIECDKHNVCRTCSIPRKKLKDIPYAGKNGWQCNPCADAAHKAKRAAALEAMAEKDYDEWDYRNNDNIVCPHCEFSWSPDGDPATDGNETCSLCGGEYSLAVEYSVEYSTEVVGKRVTA